VVRRLERGHDSPAWRVALDALGGSPTKNALKVAPLALDLCMASTEGKSGSAVIQLDISSAATLSVGFIG